MYFDLPREEGCTGILLSKPMGMLPNFLYSKRNVLADHREQAFAVNTNLFSKLQKYCVILHYRGPGYFELIARHSCAYYVSVQNSNCQCLGWM